MPRYTPPATGGGTQTPVDTSKLVTVIVHDGTAGGGTRPTGYAQVVWISPVGTVYARPGNMLAGDIWERDA